MFWIIWSRLWRNRDRSRFWNGGGPPIMVPASRSSVRRSRVASTCPMLTSDKTRPVGPRTCAPFLTHLYANGVSVVTTISSLETCSTIQLSAASNWPSTTTSFAPSWSGIRINEFETNVTFSRYRFATLQTSCLTGQASASTKIFNKLSSFSCFAEIHPARNAPNNLYNDHYKTPSMFSLSQNKKGLLPFIWQSGLVLFSLNLKPFPLLSSRTNFLLVFIPIIRERFGFTP